MSNTALYPYRKAVRFGEIEAEKAKSSLSVIDNTALSASDPEILAELSYEPDDLYTPVSKKSAIKYFIEIIDYINYAITALNTFNFLMKLDEKELDFLGIKISKSALKIVKWIILGAGAFVCLSFLLEKFLKNDLLKAANKKILEFFKKLMPYISALLKIIFALYGIYLIYVLIKMRLNGKKWKINDTEKLLSGVVMLLAVLDIKWVEQRLADSKKGYIIATGVSFIAKLSKTALIPFTTDEPVHIKKDKFEKADVDADTLFLYFCGTRENTDKHLNQFMKDIKAKHQIYISGIGSSQAIYEKLYEDDLDVSVKEIGKNSRKYHFESKNRDITCIEKVYTGGDLGYNEIDARQVAQYAYNAFKDTLNARSHINKIVIAGHSRGAAVALMSFLYEAVGKFEELSSRLSSSKIAVFPLDPVAGQTGNKYPMGDKWTSKEIYHKLYELFSFNLSICEVWARSASMFDQFGVGADFHPAKRLLHNPSIDTLMLSRFLLGYEHSAMVSDEESYSKHYSPKLNSSPYKLFVRFLNDYIDSLSSLDASKFTEISERHRAVFDQTDKEIRDAGVMNYNLGIRTVYENHSGKRINFLDFITSFDEIRKSA